MRRTIRNVSSPVLVTVVIATVVWVNAGNLAPPPGAIMPTDRVTINQQVDTLPYTIAAPGSYVLTSNLIAVPGHTGDGIRIVSDDVTLDLNGFSVVGVPGSQSGILVAGDHENIAVFNGTVRDWGASGVQAFSATNSEFRDLRLSDNVGNGMLAGPGSTVDRCVAKANGITGIITAAGASAQGGVVTRCTATKNGADGYFLGDGSRITNSLASGNSANGFNAADAVTILHCTAHFNSLNGIEVSNGCYVAGNTVRGDGILNSVAGIHVIGTDNRVEDNHVTGGLRGLWITGVENTVANNTVRGNISNYDIVAGNQLNILLCEIPQTIFWPAHVTLAGSLTGPGGITIESDDVTVDLDGHTLAGTPANILAGISISALRNIEIRNGTIKDWGLQGISASDCRGLRVIDIRAISNGAAGIEPGLGSHVSTCTALSNGSSGIMARPGSVVENCVADLNGEHGINAESSAVTGCTARSNGSDGIYMHAGGVVTNCLSSYNTGNGIASILDFTQLTAIGCTARKNGNIGIAVAAGTVESCSVMSNGSDGILATTGVSVIGCSAVDNSGSGIAVVKGNSVLNCVCKGNNIAGIYLLGHRNRVSGNELIENEYGIFAEPCCSLFNLVIRNSASNNTNVDYSVEAIVNQVGPTYTGLGSITTTNPWANFSR